MSTEAPPTISKGPDTQPVDGKRVLITGGTTGIGRATALLLARHGARVMVFGRHRPELEETLREAEREGHDIAGITADVAEADGVRAVFAEVDRLWGGLDILVNNAALAAGEVASSSYEEIDYVVRTNLTGYMACASEAVSRMPDGGIIVNVGSMSAEVREPGSSVYVATKSGIDGFSEALRKEVNPQGIKVCLIEPGAVATEMQSGPEEAKAGKVERLEMLRSEDIASVILFCLAQPVRSDVVMLRVRPHLQLI